MSFEARGGSSASMIDFDVNKFSARLNLRDKTVDRILECATTTF